MNNPAAQSKPLPPAEDAEALLKMMDVQIALQRAKRAADSGSSRRNAQLMGVFFILLIVIIALGALWHLKSSMPDAPIRRSSPGHATSAPPVR